MENYNSHHTDEYNKCEMCTAKGMNVFIWEEVALTINI